MESEYQRVAESEFLYSPSRFRVFWEIVPGTQCNFECLTCYAAENARPDPRLLNWDEAKIALDKAISLGVNHIDILGGEPLTYKHLEKFINHFKTTTSDSFCGVVSNGSLVTPDRAKALLNSGLDQLTISLDGVRPETNDANRGEGTFRQALEGVGNALNAGLPLTIAYTVTPFNMSDAPELFSFVGNLGVEALSVQITEMSGRARKTLSGFNLFTRLDGLRTICRMFHSRPPIYVDVSTRNLLKEFLNHFFNAGLVILDVDCDGGKRTLMVSSGGDLYPCSEYAYFSDGRQKNRGVNLVSDDIPTVKEFVEDRLIQFNARMKLLEKKKFTTCRDCLYRFNCAPCPLANPRGTVPECEWVKSQKLELNKSILNSKVTLLREPVMSIQSETQFLVPTQKSPITIPIDEGGLRRLLALESVARIIEFFRDKGGDSEETEDKVIEFLCKLRSHRIVEIDALQEFLR